MLDARGDALVAMLVDYSLAEGPCGALVAHARAARPSLPVVVMSGYPSHFPGVVGERADAFLAKPFGVDELAGAVVRAIARTGAHRGRGVSPSRSRGTAP